MKKIFTRELLPLYAIIAGGLVFRLWQINWGLPELFEEATPLRVGWGFWNWGRPGLDFNPHFFHYPALTFYIQFIAQAINYGIGHLFGSYPNLDAFGLTLTPLAVTARIITVLFDLGTIAVVYTLTNEIADKRTAFFAACITALNPTHILHAHYVEVDPVLTFFSTLALLYIVRIYHRPETKWYLLAGLFIALAAASKYTGALLILVLLGAHFLSYPSLRSAINGWQDRPLLYSIFIAVAVFFLLNPYILLDYTKFSEDFSFEQYHVAYGHLGIDTSHSTLGFYLLDVLPTSFGILFSLTLLGSFIHLFVTRKKSSFILWLYPLIYTLVISTWEMRADRYFLPIFPVLSVLGAIGIITAFDWFIEKVGNSARFKPIAMQHTVLGATCIIMLVQPVLTNELYLRSIGLPDTRTLTKTWIKQTLPAGNVIATGPYGVDFPDSSYRILSIPFLAVQSENVAPFYETQWYEDCDLLMTSSYDYSRYAREPKKYAQFLPFYDTLKTKWKKVYEVVPTDAQNGPAFWLYTYPDSLRRQNFDMTIFQRLYENPESTRISNFLKDIATIETEKGKYIKSEQVLKEILNVEVDNYPLRNRLAQVLYNMGKYNAALNQLEQSVRANPNQPTVLALAGSALLHVNQPVPAEGVLQRAISLNPQMEQPYRDLIELYQAQKQRGKLLDILKRYYGIIPRGTDKAKEIRSMIDQLGGLR
jgi:4-amino-4-deoxy-L-arabinose transferase-like glycosyltransferase/tetratricopeptide (TPR) repeat protein